MRTQTLLKVVLSLFFLVNLVSCGNDYDDEDIKQYYLHLDTDDSAAQAEFKSLIDYYNAEAGFLALHYAASKSDSNSSVLLTPGLQKRDGKVGWGQWIKNSELPDGVATMPGKKQRRVNVYSMRLEFDKEYFMERLKAETEELRVDLFKLFTHEVCHGLEMNHVQDLSNVMYPDISGDKNFDQYFERVRRYF